MILFKPKKAKEWLCEKGYTFWSLRKFGIEPTTFLPRDKKDVVLPDDYTKEIRRTTIAKIAKIFNYDIDKMIQVINERWN